VTTTSSWSSRVRRRWRLVVLAPAVGVVLGVVAQTEHPVTYTATATVLTTGRGDPLPTPLVALRSVTRPFGRPTTSLVEVRFTAGSADKARQAADAAAQAAVSQARAAVMVSDAQAYELALADVHAVRRELTAAFHSESRQALGFFLHSDTGERVPIPGTGGGR
jgi:hypothetical protein